MNRNTAILLGIALLTLPLIWLFIPESKPGTISSVGGVQLSSLDGQKFKLSGLFAEKKILLVFWSITCGSCIEEIPLIIKLHDRFKDKVTIIGIHPPGMPLAKIQKFLRKFPEKIPYLIAVDDEMKLTRTYEASILPKAVLLNQKGEVLYSHLGYESGQDQEIEDAIRKTL